MHVTGMKQHKFFIKQLVLLEDIYVMLICICIVCVLCEWLPLPSRIAVGCGLAGTATSASREWI